MALPKAIQKQIDEAADIEKVLSEESGTPVANTPDQPETPAAEPVPIAEEIPKSQAQEDDIWRKKYSVLEGKYRAEVPLLNKDVSDLKRANAELMARFETLSKKEDEVQTKKPESLITPKDQDAFGEDLVDFTKRAAKEVISSELALLTTRLGALEQAIANIAGLPKKVGEVVEKQALTEEQAFWRELGTLIPDWEAVDSNPAWIEHLDTKAKYVQATHRQLAELAVAERNISAVVELVSDWKALSGITALEQTKELNKNELKKQITPNKTSTVTPTSSEPETHTWDEYNAAFDPRASRMLSPAEVEALQAKMETAYLEGRIV